MKQKCTDILKKLTNKKHIFFTDRGNTSILLALKLARQKYDKLFMQDQGGWITYEQYVKKLKFDYHLLDTDFGIVKDVKNKQGVFLINSMPGYFCNQDMKIFPEFLINDASGSIGTNAAKIGDLIIGSFGRWKPINLEYGGFIAFDNPEYEKFFKENFNKELKDFYKELYPKLEILNKRLRQFKEISNKIKSQLKEFEILHKNHEGINVIVKINSPEQKIAVIDYCRYNGYEYTECPRYIRVLTDAISIEVKRL